MSLKEKPYLSVVMCSRNDDYGGNMLQRMQVSLSGLLEQLEKHRIESELILVDWNPPADKPLLKDVLIWPDRLRYCTIRVIVVPPLIHRRYEYSNKTSMNVNVAINCGIKRSRGDFILPSNVGLLYSDDLVSYIASKGLKKKERYRVDRCDVDRNVVECDTLEKQLDYCKNNIICTNAHIPKRTPRMRLMRNDLPNLHTNACGDFQLMSRCYWHLFRGYRESGIISSYTDGLLSYASYAAGIREIVLNNPMRLYHIDHDDKLNDMIKRTKLPFENWLSLPLVPTWFNNKIISLYGRFLMLMGYKYKSSVYGIPTLDSAEYRKIARDMVAGKHSFVLNDGNWGLGEESLEEFVISNADWEKKEAKDESKD